MQQDRDTTGQLLPANSGACGNDLKGWSGGKTNLHNFLLIPSAVEQPRPSTIPRQLQRGLKCEEKIHYREIQKTSRRQTEK